MSDLLIEKNDGLLSLTLNRPEQMNAMSGEMVGQATAAVMDVVENKSARAILLTGAGRGFCAGADLSGGGLTDARETIEGRMMAGINRLILAIREVPVPVVVALNGAAAGAGCGLALAGDMIIAGQSGKLLTAFARIGAVLDGGMSWSLTNKLGPARAMGMAMLADQPIDAQTAKDWGLVWDVVEDQALMDEATKLARRFATGPTVALGLIKRQIALAQTGSMADALRFEAACQGQAFKTDDFPEGVKAFQEKRKANFVGR
ncbi:MAG: enoyl-CoA hydratase [Rhodospirillaceae bacterium]|jgi:2-(1,2-epoxy-1,2-dihydrophenyl)acetyl-CoA isomerase|nr:enoyl-CoA hydratase [Rhodospirillaceae bacterium]MBT3492733.1 enoyl-CoA hydratase [Rhodospirillaceae bacterium]MBT3779572.1 enoyl-CoA hydratase [Rhodospirillaceae bacterium]MBT3975865.1 enoyl-CoA hydratase [Rhodospirillaceae bacterium]MBT4168345.1 enoyl-CoA hydratase [Rhodospirillaceae bacterium]